MYQGQHANRSSASSAAVKRNRKKRNRSLALILSLVLLLAVAGGATVAYFSTRSGENKAGFTAGTVSCSVSGGVVTNEGNVPVYVRAAVVVNWVDKDGNIRGIAPTAADYTVTPGTGWSLQDGYYYYKDEVAVKGNAEQKSYITTPVCTVSLNSGVSVPEGYSLETVILAEAIQAAGSAQSAWTSQG